MMCGYQGFIILNFSMPIPPRRFDKITFGSELSSFISHFRVHMDSFVTGVGVDLRLKNLRTKAYITSQSTCNRETLLKKGLLKNFCLLPVEGMYIYSS